MNAPTIGITAFKAYKCGIDLSILELNVFSINEITRTELPFIKYIIWLKRIHFKQATSLAFLFVQLRQRLHKADKLLLLQITWPNQGRRCETDCHKNAFKIMGCYYDLFVSIFQIPISQYLKYRIISRSDYVKRFHT